MDDGIISLINGELNKKGGKYIDIGNNDYGLFIGATYNDNGYYYLFIKSNLDLSFVSTIYPLKNVSETIPNNKFSILEYLATTNPIYLIDMVKEKMRYYKDIIITSLYIKPI